jgi:hypothetical protein
MQFLWGILMERGYLEYLRVHAGIILKRVFKKFVRMLWSWFMWLRKERSGDRCERCNESSVSIQCGDFLG